MGRPTPIVPCEVCGVRYLRTVGGPVAVCSDECMAVRRRTRWLDRRGMHETDAGLFAPCRECGGTFRVGDVGSNGGPRIHRCATCRLDIRRAYRRRGNTRRRGVRVRGAYRLAQIAERDGGWVCHLCDGPIDPTLSGLLPLGPTVDHVLPVSKGGADTFENVALAHRRCNNLRGNRTVADARADSRLLL